MMYYMLDLAHCLLYMKVIFIFTETLLLLLNPRKMKTLEMNNFDFKVNAAEFISF